ncbi:unnamed protein product [Lactuca virosa]|uniref:Uncharacterized protein n=1 Tax=Lactuca virosa TaxID=75947 RepID=A0AAU9N5H9_9ASTR|nr:unnamed protein product [Lactuca virosa]
MTGIWERGNARDFPANNDPEQGGAGEYMGKNGGARKKLYLIRSIVKYTLTVPASSRSDQFTVLINGYSESNSDRVEGHQNSHITGPWNYHITHIQYFNSRLQFAFV